MTFNLPERKSFLTEEAAFTTLLAEVCGYDRTAQLKTCKQLQNGEIGRVYYGIRFHVRWLKWRKRYALMEAFKALCVPEYMRSPNALRRFLLTHVIGLDNAQWMNYYWEGVDVLADMVMVRALLSDLNPLLKDGITARVGIWNDTLGWLAQSDIPAPYFETIVNQE